MANFYAEVKQLIKGCDISFIEPLSYMKHFLTSENLNEVASTGKIVLLYKNVSVCKKIHIFLQIKWRLITICCCFFFTWEYKGLPSKSPQQLQPKSETQNGCAANISNLHNLTGSPLKDSCQFELMNESMSDELLPRSNAWKHNEEQYQSIPMEESQ